MTLAWLRPDLPAAYPFHVGEQPCSAKLDQNETPVDLPAELKADLAAELAGCAWNRYVQPADYAAAKRGLAAAAGLDPDWLAVTVGADQAIEAAFLIAGGPGRRARWFEPTYPYIAHCALRTGTAGTPLALGAEVDAAIDAAAIDAGPRCDLVALVAPNNPTGGLPGDAAVAAALAEPRRLLLLDEAYADFAGTTRLPALAAHANLLVARSLSKSSLAGIHVGFAAAHPDAIAGIERMLTAPYHLDALQLVIARRYPELVPHVRAAAAAVTAERDQLHAALAALPGIGPRPSRANFVLFAVAGPPARALAVHRHLGAAGIRIRNVGALPGLAGHLRVTVGTSAENARFVAALSEALE
jgi:histidinol-phosphate aminotransferase